MVLLSKFDYLYPGFEFGKTSTSKPHGQSIVDFCFPDSRPRGNVSRQRAQQMSAFLNNEPAGSSVLMNQRHWKSGRKTRFISFLRSSSFQGGNTDGDGTTLTTKRARQLGGHATDFGEKIQKTPCSDRKTEDECDEHDPSVEQECGWSHTVITGTKLSPEDGRCVDAHIPLWPKGLDLVKQLTEVFAIEGTIAFTACYLRNNGVEIWQALGVPKPSYQSRVNLWWYPTSTLYVLLGLYYYRKTQGWDTVDALYFIAQVFSTVGYGDVFPGDMVAKVFTLFHVCLGIALVGGACGDSLDVIFESRINRANYVVALAADYKDLIPSIWEAALQIRRECQNEAKLQHLVRQLQSTAKYMKLNDLDSSAIAWLEHDPIGRLVHREVTGTGHMIPWPQGVTKKVGNFDVTWDAPAPRLRSLLSLLKLAATHESVPKLKSEEMLDVFATDVMNDIFIQDHLRNAAGSTWLLLIGGTLFFGCFDNLANGHNMRTPFEGFYMTVIGATTVGFGDFAAHNTMEKLFCLWFFSHGVIITSNFIMYLGEMFAFKGASSMDIFARFDEAQARDMARLKDGEHE